MAITVDVITRAVESSLRSTSDNIDRHFTETGKKAGENFSKALGEGVAKSPELQKAFDKAADAAGKLRAEQEKLNAVNAKANATDAQKIAQAERVEAAKRAEARAVREAADAYDRYGEKSANGLDRVNRGAASVLNVLADITSGTRLGGLTAEIGNMASGFATAGASVGRFGASFAASGLIAGGTVVLGLAAAAAGAAALTKELYDLGSQWDNTFDSIAVKTGATGDTLAQIQQSVRDVAGQIPQDLGAIGDVASGVASSLKLVGQDANEIISTLGNMQAMGFEVNIHDLGQAYRALNVDQQDYIKVLEQMTYLSQTSNTSIDSITASITGSAEAIKGFGLNSDEVLNLLDAFEKSGVDPDKGVGALSKAFAKLSEAGIATKDGLSQVLSEIKAQMSYDMTGAEERLNNLFGKRGGGLSWLSVMSDDAFNIANALEAPRSSIEGLKNDTYDWSESWKMMKNDISTALEPLSSEMFAVVGETFKEFSEWIKDNKSGIIGFFTGVATQVVNFANVTAKAIGGMVMGLGDFLEEIPGLGDFGKGMKDSGESILDFGYKLDEMQAKLQAAGDRANDLAKFSKALGDNVELLPDGKTIVLKDNSAEALARIDSTKYAIENLPDGNVKVVAKTDEASREMETWIDEQNGTPVEPPVEPDLKPANNAIEQWRAKLESDGVTIPIDGSLVGVPVPGSGPVTNDPFGVPKMQNFYEPGMVPNNRKLMDAVSQMFPGVKAAADTGRRDKFGEHGAGQALDISVNPGNQLGIKTPQGQMTGSQINQWLLDNAKAFGLQYTIWQGKQWNPDGTTAPNAGQGITGGHWDHVHVRVRPGPAASGGMRRFGPTGPAPGGFASLSSSITEGMKMFGPQDGPDTGSILPTGPTFAPGLEPGPVGSTPGYNEYGEPGYYRPESGSVRSAERGLEDANERSVKAEERYKKAQEAVADKEAEIAEKEKELAAIANQSEKVKERERLQKELDRLGDQKEDLLAQRDDAAKQRGRAMEDAQDAAVRVDEARRGRFTAAKESPKSRSGGGGGGVQIGAPLADDMGLSEGLPGLARFATTFLANLAFAPAIGALSAFTGGQGPDQTGYGLMGMLFGGGGGTAGTSMYPTASLGGGMPGVGGLGIPMPGVGPSTVASTASPAPVGGGLGSTIHGGTGAPPGPGVTPQTSMQPSAGPGGGGFAGIGGMPMALANTAIQAGALAIDAQAPGAGQAASAAAQMAIQLANRTAGYIGQAAAIGVGGLMETFLPHNSAVADPNRSWIGRIAAGFAGARPATPNAAGGESAKPDEQKNPAGEAKPPQTPEEAAKQAQERNGGQGGPMVNVENMNVGSPNDGQAMTNQLDRMALSSYAAGGPR